MIKKLTLLLLLPYMTDLQILAAVIHSECSICPTEEKLMVGSVVLNRMRLKNKTMRQVVAEKNQFHGMGTDKNMRIYREYALAAKLLMHGPIDSAVTHFYRPEKTVRNHWSRQMRVIKKYKYHNFCENVEKRIRLPRMDGQRCS